MKCKECITYAICRSKIVEFLNISVMPKPHTDYEIFSAYNTTINPKCDKILKIAGYRSNSSKLNCYHINCSAVAQTVVTEFSLDEIYVPM